jgi:NAD(P) transhydrogenase
MQFDLAIIGNDEAAFEMQCLAAQMGRRVVAILPESRHSSWIVGQALRKLVSNLLVDRSVSRQKMFASAGTPRLLQRLIARAVAAEVSEQIELLKELGVEVRLGESRFEAGGKLFVSEGAFCRRVSVDARYTVIGTGVRQTAMHRPLGLVPFHRPESLFEGTELPESLCVVGGDATGAGLAALFSLFGVRARHVAREENESAMLELAMAAGVSIGFHPADVGLSATGSPSASVHADVVDCRRKVGFTKNLNLSAIGVEPDENGQLWCSASFETWCPGVFGVGEVVGFCPQSNLLASVQAERVMNRIVRAIPRPHFAMNRVRSNSALRIAR